MKRSSSVVLGTAFIVGIGLCSFSVLTDETSLEDADHTQVCVDPETQERVEDERCPDGGGHWYYGSSSYRVPKVGSKVDTAHFSTAKPSGAIAKVPRGGFGGHGGGGS